MRPTVLHFALLAAVFGSPVAAQTPEKDVRQKIVAMMAAAEALDANAFMQTYWQSPALRITFDSETMAGWKIILQEQQKWWSHKDAGIKFIEDQPPLITAQGPQVVTSIQWINVSTNSTPKPSKLVITSVWKKLPEGWRVILAHETLTP
jgi:ketosteroid isomerase-like protein